MTRVTIDATTWAKLLALRDVAALCDEAGRIIGHFHPGPPRDANGNIIIPISEEELARRSREGRGGRPLKDILRDLENL
jgi:hypothetical protein